LLSGCSGGRTATSAKPSASGSSAPVDPASPPAPLSGAPSVSAAPKPGTGGVPRPDHIVVAVFENHGYDQVVGSGKAPYLNRLAAQGTLLTDSHGVTHPSQPNYIAMFAGSTFGVSDDSCPRDFGGTANLGSQLANAGLSFAGYSEGMPSTGYRGCGGGDKYARKHNAWVDFTVLPTSVNRTFADFPSDFASLPTVSFVVPNLCNDMHDCSVSTGDSWAQAHLDPYVRWAAGHNSLLVITWDEDENPGGDKASGGHIPTILVGGPVAAGGRYTATVDHYRVLRTIEAAYGLPGLGTAAGRQPVTGIWR
jgi:acid phosphatase